MKKKTDRQKFNDLMKPLFETIQWLAKNGKTIKKFDNFEYPEYAGLPEHLGDKLSSGFVDMIQDNWDFIKTSRSVSTITKWILPL